MAQARTHGILPKLGRTVLSKRSAEGLCFHSQATIHGGAMKALVAVKRVVDYNVKVRAKADGTDVELNNVKMAINPKVRRK